MKRLLSLLVLALSASSAMAHPAIFHSESLSSAAQAGFFHPFTGLDHLLVMIAVGLWAVQMSERDSRALWLLPLSFVSSMILGAMLGISGIHLAVVESGILASIVILGASLGMAWCPPVWIAALFVGACGLCHGYAHGSEMGAGMIPALFLMGMVAATSFLHALGVGGGLLLRNNRFLLCSRIAGGLLVAFGVYNFFTAIS